MAISSTRGNLYVMDSSTWKMPTNVSYHNGMAWNPVQKVYVMTGGQWEQVWPSDSTNYNGGATYLYLEIASHDPIPSNCMLDPRWFITGTGGIKDFVYGDTSNKQYYNPWGYESHSATWGFKNLWHRGDLPTPSGAYQDDPAHPDTFEQPFDQVIDRTVCRGTYPWTWIDDQWYSSDTVGSSPPSYTRYYYTPPWTRATLNNTTTPSSWDYSNNYIPSPPYEFGEYGYPWSSVTAYEYKGRNAWKSIATTGSNNVTLGNYYPVMKYSQYEDILSWQMPSVSGLFPHRCIINLSLLKLLFPNEKIKIQGSAQWQEYSRSSHPVVKGSTTVAMRATMIKGRAFDTGLFSESLNDISNSIWDGVWHVAPVNPVGGYGLNENGYPADGTLNLNGNDPAAKLLILGSKQSDLTSVNSSYQVNSSGNLVSNTMNFGDKVGCVEIDLSKDTFTMVSDDLKSEAESVFKITGENPPFTYALLGYDDIPDQVIFPDPWKPS